MIVNTVTDGPTGDMYRQAAEGLVEPIDWKRLDPVPMFDEAKNENGFGASYYSTIMAWRSDAKAPQNWWTSSTPRSFPGKRALPDYPEFVLPFAAMGGRHVAGGRSAKGLISIAPSRRLNRIKKDTIWWQSGAQPAQLLKDNEAQYAIAWSGRVSARMASPAPKPGHARYFLVGVAEGDSGTKKRTGCTNG